TGDRHRDCPGRSRHGGSSPRHARDGSPVQSERRKEMKALRDYESKVFDKINPLVNFSIRRYVLAIGIFVAVVIFGIVSTLGLGVDLLPNIVIPAVVVRTSYPGATPSVMDLQVTQVVENVISSISGITDINSFSSQGVSRVVLTFDPST